MTTGLHLRAGLLLLALCLGLQMGQGAYRGEFGGHDDEAGHYITGLMIRDYVAAGCPGSPLRFAQEYYLHYPKVALGHWPPLFYLVQLPWTLLLPPDRLALMACMAILTTLLALAVYRVAADAFSPWAAWAVGAGWLVLPLVRQYGGLLMADMANAVFCFWAAWSFGCYLEGGRRRAALGFGVWSALAILTKGSSWLLALVPPLALLLTRRWELLRRPAFWLPVPLVLALCAPWYALTFRLMKNGFENPQGLASSLKAIPFYTAGFADLIGPGLVVVLFIGWAAQRGPHSIQNPTSNIQNPSGVWPAMGALLLAVPLFHCLVTNAYDTRYLLPALAPAMLFVAAGARQLVAWLGRWCAPRLAAGGVVVVLVALLAQAAWRPIPTGLIGMSAAADAIRARPDAAGAAVLVVSDARGEGALIAQVARREARPGRYILRASKALASSRWDGSAYTAAFQTPDALLQFLESVPVGVLVWDRTIPAHKHKPHHTLLADTLARFPERLRRVGVYPAARNGVLDPAGIQIYEGVGLAPVPPAELRDRLAKIMGQAAER